MNPQVRECYSSWAYSHFTQDKARANLLEKQLTEQINTKSLQHVVNSAVILSMSMNSKIKLMYDKDHTQGK